jgi:signal transduction histidine kinase
MEDPVNILLVDDLPDKLLALHSLLENPEHNVVTARSGRDALRRLLEQDFAVILLDVNMPEMDGFETAALIRQHKRCARTPIIFVTAFADEMLTSRGYSLGAVDYILSPVVPAVLRTKVSVFVDLFRKTEQARRHAEERVALAREQAARLAAEEANRRKDEFLAMLSHELRNPLAPIRNALEILSFLPMEDPIMQEARAVLDRQVRQLTGIVDDLLDVFRITHRKITLHAGPLDLVELVRLTVEDHRQSIENEGRKVIMADLPEPLWINADRKRLAQVLSNLLNNATKFTNPGDHITVVVTRDAERDRAVVAVRDTGIGIEREILPHVFEIFAQAEQGMDRRRGGLGLGLSLVKGIVELHGGEVQAFSAGPGKGAEMSFRLPLSKAPIISQSSTPPAAGTSKALRILIVEDNPDTARSLQLLLRRFGHEVETAHTGPTGVSAASTWLPEVVLCDLGLPELDGYGVARALRESPTTCGTRLIALSGYGQEEDLRRSREAGFDLHLIKPVDPMELQQLLIQG